ncbi:MAG: MFS transporter, partial [Pseudoclavibacter sp.]
SSRGFAVPWAAMIAMFMLLFTYIGGASYVYQDDYGVTSEAFGLLFAIAGFALMVGAAAASRSAQRLPQKVLALTGVGISAIGAVIAVAVTVISAPIWALVVGVSVIMLGLGVAEPALMSNSMSAVEENTGQAAALLGAGQFVLGAAASGIAGVFITFGPSAWAAMLLAIVVLALTLSFASIRARR